MSAGLPPGVGRRAQSLLDGSWTAPAAIPAATVAVLRLGPEGVQALMMARPATMAFAPGMYVFPGGRVEIAADGAESVPWVRGRRRARLAGTSPVAGDSWAQDERTARALVVAAVRETFEEAGVLLAVTASGGTPVGDDSAWAADRQAVTSNSADFPAMLGRRGLRIDPQLLTPLAHWVTPEVETRRFDTRFFAAVLPPSQHATEQGTESDHLIWIRPADALERFAAQQLPLLPPTVAVLTDLADRPSTADMLGAPRAIRPLMPRPFREKGAIVWWLVDAYTGERLARIPEPHASEHQGTGGTHSLTAGPIAAKSRSGDHRAV